MEELLKDFFILNTTNRVAILIMLTIMIALVFIIIVLNIIKKQKSK